MRHSQIALTAVLALALAGCAATPSRPQPQKTGSAKVDAGGAKRQLG